MSSDEATRNTRSSFRTVGIGMSMHFSCMGCRQLRPGLGAKGSGIKKRCAECVAKQKAKNEQSV